MGLSLFAIAIGAALGALLRWGLAVGLNDIFPSLPPGTLLANAIGGYGIGLALAFFAQHPELPPVWRLFVVTGFLGGLTTFSTFSAEVVALLHDGRVLAAGAAVAAHVGVSLALTLAGFATVAALRG